MFGPSGMFPFPPLGCCGSRPKIDVDIDSLTSEQKEQLLSSLSETYLTCSEQGRKLLDKGFVIRDAVRSLFGWDGVDVLYDKTDGVLYDGKMDKFEEEEKELTLALQAKIEEFVEISRQLAELQIPDEERQRQITEAEQHMSAVKGDLSTDPF